MEPGHDIPWACHPQVPEVTDSGTIQYRSLAAYQHAANRPFAAPPFPSCSPSRASPPGICLQPISPPMPFTVTRLSASVVGRRNTSGSRFLREARALAVVLALPLIACAGASAGAERQASSAAGESAGVIPGVEVLLRDSLHLLEGKRVGLITNHSGRDLTGTSSIDLLKSAPGVELVALFSPEHGIRGAADAGEKVASGLDDRTGLPIHSLYGETRVPTDSMLAGLDFLVYDIQDAGARVYTYVWTMALAAEKAGSLGIPFMVLDRPNPIRADIVQGGVLEQRWASFVGQYPVALRYGLTPGELLRYLVGTGQVKVDLTVIPMDGYSRDMWFDDTGIEWVNPSPNLRSVDATLLYTGTVFFEATNLSEGRGTDLPFQLVGAKWLDAAAVAEDLNDLALPGVRFSSTERTVDAGQKWGGETIPMVQVEVTDRNSVRPADVGIHMLRAIRSRHISNFEWRAEWLERLTGTTRARAAVESADGVSALLDSWRAESAEFERLRAPYLIY